MTRVEIYRSARPGKQKGKWRARVRHANGKVLIITSEAYVKRSDAVKALRTAAKAINAWPG